MKGTENANTINLRWFGKWTYKQLLIVFAALAIALALTLFGFGSSCMCFGALIIAVILYMLPRTFGVVNIKLMTVVGAIFFAVTMLIGGLVIAPGFVDNNQGDPDVSDSEYFESVTYGYTSGHVGITVTMDPGFDMSGKEVYFQSGVVRGIGLGGTVNGSMNSDDYRKLTADDADPSKLTGSIDLDPNSLYIGGLAVKDISDSENETFISGSNTPSVFLTGAYEGSITGVAFTGTFFSVFIIILMFFMIMILSSIMKGRMEKTREQMEKDGRLYPQGQGRCKKCGAMVLPGEVTCRKCGEYIDRPKEMKPDKKDFFECSECGAEVPADADRCPKCGAAFDEEDEVVIVEPAEKYGENIVPVPDHGYSSEKDPLVCPECGSISSAGAWFCPKCGRSFDEKK